MLTTCTALALSAFARRATVRCAAIDRYLLPAGPQQLQSLPLCPMLEQTDGRPIYAYLHRPCTAYYADSAREDWQVYLCYCVATFDTMEMAQLSKLGVPYHAEQRQKPLAYT